MTGTDTNSIRLVKDISPVNIEGSINMKGLNFTDTLQVVNYESP